MNLNSRIRKGSFSCKRIIFKRVALRSQKRKRKYGEGLERASLTREIRID